VSAIVAQQRARVAELLRHTPHLAKAVTTTGASRKGALDFFFQPIKHYMYAGDTALHMAAAAFEAEVAQMLIDRGANVAARNGRGAEPLHYAADANHWNPDAQAATIRCLIRAGANPDALDKSGVAPIHRAVRTRSAAAVEALLKAGANVNLANGSGSTALDLTTHNTGRGGSGSPEAIEQRRRIVLLLEQHGAKRRRN
jgi:hypothetical protein